MTMGSTANGWLCNLDDREKRARSIGRLNIPSQSVSLPNIGNSLLDKNTLIAHQLNQRQVRKNDRTLKCSLNQANAFYKTLKCKILFY